MGVFLMVGSLVGLIFSLFHAIYMFRLVNSTSGTATPGSPLAALNFSLWTIVLWVLLGAYLFGFWLLAVVFYLVFKAFR